MIPDGSTRIKLCAADIRADGAVYVRWPARHAGNHVFNLGPRRPKKYGGFTRCYVKLAKAVKEVSTDDTTQARGNRIIWTKAGSLFTKAAIRHNAGPNPGRKQQERRKQNKQNPKARHGNIPGHHTLEIYHLATSMC